MRTATELLAEMLAIHADPDNWMEDVAQWVCQHQEEIKDAIDSEQDDKARGEGG